MPEIELCEEAVVVKRERRGEKDLFVYSSLLLKLGLSLLRFGLLLWVVMLTGPGCSQGWGDSHLSGLK